MFDEMLTEEERDLWVKKNEEMIAALQKQGIKMGRIIVHITQNGTLSVKIRGDRPGEADEYIFYPNGKMFEKVN